MHTLEVTGTQKLNIIKLDFRSHRNTSKFVDTGFSTVPRPAEYVGDYGSFLADFT